MCKRQHGAEKREQIGQSRWRLHKKHQKVNDNNQRDDNSHRFVERPMETNAGEVKQNLQKVNEINGQRIVQVEQSTAEHCCL